MNQNSSKLQATTADFVFFVQKFAELARILVHGAYMQ